MIKLVVFDVDGVIADTLPMALKKGKDVAKGKGVEVPKNLKEFFVNRSAKEVMEYFKISKFTGIRIIKLIRDDLTNNVNKIKIFPGMENTVKKTGGEYNVAVLSTASKKFLKKFLENNNINIFHEVVGEVSVFGKEGKLKKLMRKFHLKPNELIYVGDEVRDLEPCNKLGIKTIAVTWGYDSEQLLNKHNPTYTAHKPGDILRILNIK